jgi:hypothetical protein
VKNEFILGHVRVQTLAETLVRLEARGPHGFEDRVTFLHEPVPGLQKEVWGMRMYHDITQRFYPDHRPLIMSNVQGIDNGKLVHPPSPAAHRYPIWWTGDTRAQWDDLRLGVQHGVDSGHTAPRPSAS